MQGLVHQLGLCGEKGPLLSSSSSSSRMVTPGFPRKSLSGHALGPFPKCTAARKTLCSFFYLKLNTFSESKYISSLHVSLSISPCSTDINNYFFPQWNNNILHMPIREFHPHLGGELSCACSSHEPVLAARPAVLCCGRALASGKWFLIQPHCFQSAIGLNSMGLKSSK